jgi:nitrilase
VLRVALPERLVPAGVDVFGRGGACIVSPGGAIVAGPLYDTEGIVVTDCDLREALHAKRYFDVVGHYGRADVLEPRSVDPPT